METEDRYFWVTYFHNQLNDLSMIPGNVVIIQKNRPTKKEIFDHIELREGAENMANGVNFSFLWPQEITKGQFEAFNK